MWKEAFADMELWVLPVTALLLFAATFLAIAVRTWRAGRESAVHTHLASLPLADDVARPDAPATAPLTRPQEGPGNG